MAYKQVEATLSTKDQVTDALRNAILNGEFKRGERIIQEELAERFGVSRMPIREALKRLEFEGLVKNEPRKGSIVYPITIEDVEEIYTMRTMNESLAALKALPYMDKGDIQRMEELLIKMEAVQINVETEEYYSIMHRKFHKLLIGKCPWRRLRENALIHWDHYLAIVSPLLLERYQHKARQEHRQIFDAAANGDAELLRTILEYHINRNKKDLIQSMKTKQKL